MRTEILSLRRSLVGLAVLSILTGCSKSDQGVTANGGQPGTTSGGNTSAQGGNSSAQGGSSSAQGGMTSQTDGGCTPTAPNSSYVLIDDMETTDHGPIQLAAVSAPLTPGYWYNSGANYAPSAGAGGGSSGAGGAAVIDTSTPPQGSFTFSTLPKPTATLNCQPSQHAAHQYCVLNGLYDTCGVGFEFAQQPDPNASSGGAAAGGASSGGAAAGGASSGGASAGGADAGGVAAGGATAGGADDGGAAAGGASSGGASAGGANAGGANGGTSAGGSEAGGNSGGGAPSVPRVTIPFDITHFKAVTFWGMTTTPDPMTGTLRVKVSFPDTDTDPRGEVCNGAGPNTSKCFNSYAASFDFTTSWQQFTVVLDPGQDGTPPAGGIGIDPTWGYQGAKWLPDQVYGINWQAQKNSAPEAGPITTDIWVDDVYFVQ